MMSGKLFILSAPSGAGKSSLAKALIRALPNLAVSVSHTTRAPRPGETHGVHYYFVTPAEFEAMIQAGRFVEHARVFGNYYGTARTSIDQLLQAGKDVILDIDWQGARRIKQVMPATVSIFILPPTRAALEQRLCNRGQDAPEVIARRMRAAVSEIGHYSEFDYVVVNDIFDDALADISAIIQGHGPKRPLTVDIAALLHE